MADWVLIPSLKELFAEFDRIAPSRDHASDGALGNAAHQLEVSDHNRDDTPGSKAAYNDHDGIPEVRAIDVDNNLNITVEGYKDPMEGAVQFLLGRCRSGAEKRLEYIIYYRRIWTRSSGWVQKPYTGTSAHTEHAHFSGRHDGAYDNQAQSWHLEDIPVALTASDLAKIQDMINASSSATAAAVLDATGWSSGFPGRKIRQHANDDQVLRNFWFGKPDATGDQIPATSPVARVVAAADLIIKDHAGAVHTAGETS